MTDEGVSFCKHHKCIVEDCNESICPALNTVLLMQTSGDITGLIYKLWVQEGDLNRY